MENLFLFFILTILSILLFFLLDISRYVLMADSRVQFRQ